MDLNLPRTTVKTRSSAAKMAPLNHNAVRKEAVFAEFDWSCIDCVLLRSYCPVCVNQTDYKEKKTYIENTGVGGKNGRKMKD